VGVERAPDRACHLPNVFVYADAMIFNVISTEPWRRLVRAYQRGHWYCGFAVYLALNVVSAVLEVLKHPEVIIGLEATALAPAWERLASACRVLDTVSQAGVGGREPMSALEKSHITTAFVKALNRAELH
jgi:hypothetical protein